MKSVSIRSHSGPNFPAFGLNKGRYSIYLRIQFGYEHMRTRITLYADTFPVLSFPGKTHSLIPHLSQYYRNQKQLNNNFGNTYVLTVG